MLLSLASSRISTYMVLSHITCVRFIDVNSCINLVLCQILPLQGVANLACNLKYPCLHAIPLHLFNRYRVFMAFQRLLF